MGRKIPEDYMGTVDELPRIPQSGWAEDYRDDWVNLVSRRLTRQNGMSDLSAGQRRVLATVAFDRAYRRTQKQCDACKGDGYLLRHPARGGFGLNPGNRMEQVECPECQGRGETSVPTIRYIGRDARTRPVCERLEHGTWRRWAIGREGQPVDPTEPITKFKFIWGSAA